MENCIYKFLNEKGEIIYIGKAKNLTQRLEGHSHLPKKCYKEVKRVEYCEFETEYEMDFAERYYIPKIKPKYNTVYRERILSFNIKDLDEKKWIKYEKPKKFIVKSNKNEMADIETRDDIFLKVNKKIICGHTGEIFNSMFEIREKYKMPIEEILMNCDNEIFEYKKHPLYKCPLSFLYYDEYLKFDEETKEHFKMRIEKNTRKIICLTTSEVFTNLNEIIEKYRINHVIDCCKGRSNYAGVIDGKPMVWKWYDEYLDMKISEIEYYIWKAVSTKYRGGYTT